MEAEVSRGEVKLLVVTRVVRDVHLAVDTRDAAVALQHDSGIVAQSRCPLLKERSDDHHSELLCQLTIEVRRWSRDRLGEVKEVNILRLAEVKPVVQLLQYDELGTIGRCRSDFLAEAETIVPEVTGIVLLDKGGTHSHLYSSSINPSGNCIVAQWIEPC